MTFQVKEFKRNLRQNYKDKFQRHLLGMVLCRLDFTPLFGFDPISTDFQNTFIDQYPTSHISDHVGYDIDVTDPKSPKVNILDSKVCELENTDQLKKIKFNSAFFILEHHKYIKFDDFKNEFHNVSNFLWKDKRKIKPTRLGLRKVNSFTLAETANVQDFEGYFNSILTNHLKCTPFENTLEGDRHMLAFNSSDGVFTVRLQYGTDLGIEKNDKVRRFILDIDVYTNTVEDNSEKCCNQLTEMNEYLFDIFIWCLETKMINFLSSKET